MWCLKYPLNFSVFPFVSSFATLLKKESYNFNEYFSFLSFVGLCVPNTVGLGAVSGSAADVEILLHFLL